jgi:hypothetical protein
VPAMPGCGLLAYSTCAWRCFVSGACRCNQQRSVCAGPLVLSCGSRSVRLPAVCSFAVCLAHMDSSGTRWCTHALSVHACEPVSYTAKPVRSRQQGHQHCPALLTKLVCPLIT